jgi:hypothetical protein
MRQHGGCENHVRCSDSRPQQLDRMGVIDLGIQGPIAAGMVMMSKRELNHLDVLAQLDSDRLIARAGAEQMTIKPQQVGPGGVTPRLDDVTRTYIKK